MGKRKTNLDDEIYFLTYGEPLYKDEISIALYGEKGNPTIINKVKKLKEKGWVTICKYENLPKKFKELVFHEDGRSDKRRNLRHYVYANSDILIEKICQRLQNKGCELTDCEKKQLKGYIDSKGYRENVRTIVELCADKVSNISDVFFTMIHMILVECVFLNSFYICLDEMNYDAGLIEKPRDLEKDIAKNIEAYRKKIGYYFPLDIELINKLFNLDIQVSNRLHELFCIYGDRIFDHQKIIAELVKQKRNLGMENKEKCGKENKIPSEKY